MEEQIKCNLCGGNMKHTNYNGTFIWECENCSNIQFEYYNKTDYVELGDFLNIKIKEVK